MQRQTHRASLTRAISAWAVARGSAVAAVHIEGLDCFLEATSNFGVVFDRFRDEVDAAQDRG